MNAALLLAFFGVRTRVTETITASRTWTAPATTTGLVTLMGKGQNGTPESGGYGYNTFETITTTYSNGSSTTTGPTLINTTYGEDPPLNYCNQSGGSFPRTLTCYSYESFNDYQPETTGASTTGFGKTFAGGVGAPANAVTYSNVATTPGGSYPLVIPAGGSITITYYK